MRLFVIYMHDVIVLLLWLFRLVDLHIVNRRWNTRQVNVHDVIVLLYSFLLPLKISKFFFLNFRIMIYSLLWINWMRLFVIYIYIYMHNVIVLLLWLFRLADLHIVNRRWNTRQINVHDVIVLLCSFLLPLKFQLLF